jgi:potassium voltage-gated channel Shaker-related subfamily A beta protein 2
LHTALLGRKVSISNAEIISTVLIHNKLKLIKRAETEKGLSRKHIIEGVKASLERLQLDYVDIVFACKPDATTPIEGKINTIN